MQLVKKIALWVLGLALLVIILNFGVSYYITKKLPSIVQKEKDFPYNVNYKSLDISLLSGSFTLHDVYLAPKDTTGKTVNKGAFGKIKTVSVSHFNLWALLRDDKIKVSRILIDGPEIQLYKNSDKYNVDDDIVKPFKNTITTGSLELTNGSFKLLDTTHKSIMSAANIRLSVDNIKVDSAIVNSNIPVRFTDYNFKCDSLFYRANTFYNITALNVISNDSTVTINKFNLVPQHSRATFTKIIPKEKDQFKISVAKIDIPKAEWGYVNDVLFVHSPTVTLTNLYANIYRNKLPKDDLTIKKLYSESLRKLDFDLKIDRLLVKNSVIEYEEQVNWQRPAAMVSFSKFYATVHNVYSPINKTKLPKTVADVQCLFMKVAPLKVQWTFNVPDVSDAFTIKGHLQNLSSANTDKLAKPLMNITTTGNLKDIRFTINGNKENATGVFAIDYDNLKVDIYKDEGKKKRKFLSAVANIFVKNDSNGELKDTGIKVERLKDKSVFNFLWRCLQEGLKQTLLPKAVSKVLPKKK